MFKAKPNINNDVHVKFFSTETEAVKYLNSTTGFSMHADDWRMLGKLQKI